MDRSNQIPYENNPQEEIAISVDDILSEFWEDYYLTHADAAEEDAARERHIRREEPGNEQKTRKNRAGRIKKNRRQQKDRYEEDGLKQDDTLHADETHVEITVSENEAAESGEDSGIQAAENPGNEENREFDINLENLAEEIPAADTEMTAAEESSEKAAAEEADYDAGFEVEGFDLSAFFVEGRIPAQEEENIPEIPAQESVPEPPVEKTHRRSRSRSRRKADTKKERRGKQEVWEEFPDTPPSESSEPFVDDFDYSSLFRMFAEPAETGQNNRADSEGSQIRSNITENGDTAEKDEAPEDVDAILQAAADVLRKQEASEAAEESGGKTAGRRGRHAAAEPAEEKPLFAEDPGDFRDILRDFMLKDQHPIYADVPGIGEKGTTEENGIPESDFGSGLSFGTASDDFTVEIPPETDRDRLAEMELNLWPDDGKAPLSDRDEDAVDTAEGISQPVSGSDRTDYDTGVESALNRKTDRAGDDGRKRIRKRSHGRSEEEGAGTESDRTKSSLLGLLRGVGNPFAAKKKALNTPAPYASWEDSIPAEGQTTESSEEKDGETVGFAEGVFTEEHGWDSDENAAPDERAWNTGGEFIRESGEETPADSAADDIDDDFIDVGEFPSFGQWILNELMSFWIKLNGVGDRQSTATMEEDREDLGAEVNVANASRYYGSQITMLRMRFQIAMALLAVMAWITLGLPVSGMLKTAKVASAMCLGLQLTVMLLCLDVVTNAIVNMTRGKFGADGLAVVMCLISSFDALAVSVGGFSTPHIPLCLFSSIALTGILLSSLLSARALRKAIRVPAIGKRAYCVTAEEGVRGARDITILKSVRPTTGFVRRAEEAPPDETLFGKTAIFQLLAALVLSLLTGLVRHGMRDTLYILSAILSCSVPITALLAFALPYYIGTQRIFSSGAALAGWSGVHDIGSSRTLIVTDRDLFPEDAVSIDTVRIFADQSAERVISYAGTMIAASGSGLGACFADLMENNDCRMRQVEDFQWLSGGGLQGRIEGHRVLCGNSDVMQLMNVKVPYRLVDAKTVLLAIDGTLCGIFQIRYIGLPEVKLALQQLIASNRHPIFAIRDFNITPDLLRDVFDVATDGYDFPPYGDRFRISEAQPSETSKVAGVICREGLGPLTHLADTGRSIYVAVRLNVIITAFVAALGMILVFLKLVGTGLVSAWLPFVLMVLGLLVVSLISLFMRF